MTNLSQNTATKNPFNLVKGRIIENVLCADGTTLEGVHTILSLGGFEVKNGVAYRKLTVLAENGKDQKEILALDLLLKKSAKICLVKLLTTLLVLSAKNKNEKTFAKAQKEANRLAKKEYANTMPITLKNLALGDVFEYVKNTKSKTKEMQVLVPYNKTAKTVVTFIQGSEVKAIYCHTGGRENRLVRRIKNAQAIKPLMLVPTAIQPFNEIQLNQSFVLARESGGIGTNDYEKNMYIKVSENEAVHIKKEGIVLDMTEKQQTFCYLYEIPSVVK